MIGRLDISTASDMVNHETLLDRLQNDFWIDGKVTVWLKSYVSSQQHLPIPQQSVLCPLLFSVCTYPRLC